MNSDVLINSMQLIKLLDMSFAILKVTNVKNFNVKNIKFNKFKK